MKQVHAHEVESDADIKAIMHVDPAHHTTMAVEHIGHILIFSVGLVAVMGLLIHNYLQTRKQKVKKE